MITTAAISKGEQVTLTKLAYTKQAGGGDLAGLTPSGKRAVTISVDNISSLAGMIRPGDFVDVIAIIPIPIQTAEGKTASQLGVLPLFQNVLVLAVGQQTGAMARDESRYQKQEAGPSPLITLALGPQETSLIAFVQEQGKIRLVLRSPQDNQVQNVPPANWDTLFRYIMPPRESTVEAEVPTVEIYRGLQKERVPLSN
jgi:pilus assembly protein CpaB